MTISGYDSSLNAAEHDTHPQTYKLWFDFEETLPIPPKGCKYIPDIEWEKENDGNYKIVMTARLKPIIEVVGD